MSPSGPSWARRVDGQRAARRARKRQLQLRGRSARHFELAGHGVVEEFAPSAFSVPPFVQMTEYWTFTLTAGVVLTMHRQRLRMRRGSLGVARLAVLQECSLGEHLDVCLRHRRAVSTSASNVASTIFPVSCANEVMMTSLIPGWLWGQPKVVCTVAIEAVQACKGPLSPRSGVGSLNGRDDRRASRSRWSFACRHRDDGRAQARGCTRPDRRLHGGRGRRRDPGPLACAASRTQLTC